MYKVRKTRMTKLGQVVRSWNMVSKLGHTTLDFVMIFPRYHELALGLDNMDNLEKLEIKTFDINL